MRYLISQQGSEIDQTKVRRGSHRITSFHISQGTGQLPILTFHMQLQYHKITPHCSVRKCKASSRGYSGMMPKQHLTGSRQVLPQNSLFIIEVDASNCVMADIVIPRGWPKKRTPGHLSPSKSLKCSLLSAQSVIRR